MKNRNSHPIRSPGGSCHGSPVGYSGGSSRGSSAASDEVKCLHQGRRKEPRSSYPRVYCINFELMFSKRMCIPMKVVCIIPLYLFVKDV